MVAASLMDFVTQRQSELKQDTLALKDKLVSLSGYKGSIMNQNNGSKYYTHDKSNFLEVKISETVT